TVLDVFFICLMLWLVSLNHETHNSDEAAATTFASRRWWPSWSLWSLWSLWFLGLAAGALSLTRENAMVFTAVILAWAVARARVSPRQRIASAGAFLAGWAIVLGPVAVRSHVVGGGFFVTTSQFGTNLYIGNHARAD